MPRRTSTYSIEATTNLRKPIALGRRAASLDCQFSSGAVPREGGAATADAWRGNGAINPLDCALRDGFLGNHREWDMQTAAVPPLVLVVDDAPTKRRKVCGLIERSLGWRTAEAATGRQTLERIKNTPPNIVLISLELPDTDGVALVESIRRSHPFVPIVLITTASNEKTALKALQAGAAS